MITDAHVIFPESEGKTPSSPSELLSISRSSPFNVEIIDDKLQEQNPFPNYNNWTYIVDQDELECLSRASSNKVNISNSKSTTMAKLGATKVGRLVSLLVGCVYCLFKTNNSNEEN